MESKLKSVDCILEVHDARIPISGRNPRLAQSFLAAKPYILVLNKSDLIPKNYQTIIKSTLKNNEKIENVIFTNSKLHTCPGLKSVVQKALELVKNGERYNRVNSKSYNIMVVGVPNVGKSSLINALRGVHMRKRHVLQVGPVAGLTKSVHQEIRVCEKPAVYLLDTPGIMNPNINNMETGMRLATCASFKDHLVGEDFVANYLLYWLNRNEEFDYVAALGLSQPTDNIHEILLHIASQRNCFHKIRLSDGTLKQWPDFQSCSRMFINHFRRLEFGRMVLDKDLLTH